MTAWPRVVIGLGANLGAREATMTEALRRIDACTPVERVSPVYASRAVGPVQPDYVNAAALVRWGGEPVALLEELLAIEASLGRVRRERWGPRTIDLDVLWIEGRAIDSPRLTVPHPELVNRPFALVPMLDVAPDAVDPKTGALYASVSVDRGSVRLVGQLSH